VAGASTDLTGGACATPNPESEQADTLESRIECRRKRELDELVFSRGVAGRQSRIVFVSLALVVEKRAARLLANGGVNFAGRHTQSKRSRSIVGPDIEHRHPFPPLSNQPSPLAVQHLLRGFAVFPGTALDTSSAAQRQWPPGVAYLFSGTE